MTPEDRRVLENAGTVADVAAGQVLIERGQHGTGLYVILDGSVVVDAPEGSRELEAGAVLGERALLNADGLRTARVRAATDVRVLAVDRAEFERLCAENPDLLQHLGADAR